MSPCYNVMQEQNNGNVEPQIKDPLLSTPFA